MDAGFRNVHNMKGVSANLGFTPLYKASDILCEALRPGNPPVAPEEIERMLQDVKDAYAAGMNAHLAKPINVDELSATLSRFLRG